MANAVFVVATAALAVGAVVPTATADEPDDTESVLWLVDQPEVDGQDPVLAGVDEALAADRDRHLVGVDRLYERVADGVSFPSDCARGVDGCGSAEALAFEALDLGVVVRLTVDRGADTIEVNYEMVDRRGETVSSGRLEAADDREAGFELVDRLFDAVGVVTFESTPSEAVVDVEGTSIGTTPVSHQFGVGTHRVRIEREGYEPIEETVEVRAGQPEYLEVELHQRPGRLRIQGAPEGAVLLVDGDHVGRADEVVDVEPGRRSIEVRADDHEPERQSLDIEPGRTTEIDVELARRPSLLRDVGAEEIADHRLQLEVGLEMGGQRVRFPGARTTDEGEERLFGGWSTDDDVEGADRPTRFVAPAGLRLGVNWEGDRLGVGILSVSLVRRSVDRPFRLVDPVDGTHQAATMTDLTSLQLRPMQLRGRLFYRNLAPFAQAGLGLAIRSINAEVEGGERRSLRDVDAFAALELGVRYHLDPQWSVGASYRTQRSFGGASGLAHVLGIQVGFGLRDVPFIDTRPPGEL